MNALLAKVFPTGRPLSPLYPHGCRGFARAAPRKTRTFMIRSAYSQATSFKVYQVGFHRMRSRHLLFKRQ